MGLGKLENKKIGVLGGSFDPAHIGHIKISKIAKKDYNLIQVIWAITKQNPFKINKPNDLYKRTAYAKKIKMCKILVFDRDGYKSKALKSKSFKKYNKKTVEFIKFNKVNISSSQLRKI